MCGFWGLVNFSPDKDLYNKLNEVQKHRGPDNQSYWSNNQVAIGHQRLSIIDIDQRSNQPLIKNNMIIAYNGEIYNYKKIRQYLKENYKCHFKTESDTEVVLEAYRVLKEKCLELFRGMFAFVIYDLKADLFFLARDHFGIKPLFYFQINNKIAFASELKTLMEVPGFDKTISHKAIIEYLNYLWITDKSCIFRCCHKLASGHYMIIDKKRKISIKRYWNIDQQKQKIKKLDNAISLTDNHIRDSVSAHLISDVPVGSFLSGGLDSSLISVLAQKEIKNLSTYTIAFNEKDKKVERMTDDAKYAKKLARKKGFSHNEIVIIPNIMKHLPKIVYTLDEPLADPAAINTFLICREIRKKDHKVMLSGMGADEIYFGYRRHKATYLVSKLAFIPSALFRLLSFLVGLFPVKIGKSGIIITRWAKRFLSFASMPLNRAYLRSYSYYSQKELNEISKFNSKPLVKEIYDDHDEIFEKYYSGDLINKICYTDIHMFMNGLNLTYTDRASMAASVEVRVPYIDREVIKNAMSISGDLKFGRWKTKNILKNVAKKYLHADFINRPKASFGVPLRSWISEDLKDMIDDLLSKEKIDKRGILNYKFIKKMIDEDRRGIKDYSYQIYQLLTLELWFQRFIDD